MRSTMDEGGQSYAYWRQRNIKESRANYVMAIMCLGLGLVVGFRVGSLKLVTELSGNGSSGSSTG